MQYDPLLEQLDWFFMSVSWTVEYPDSEVLPMAKITSDHIPCKGVLATKFPGQTFFALRIFGWNMQTS
jgi:hypothetical protein